MIFTRRRFLILLALLAFGDYGRNLFMMNERTPPGWKTVRWQAGFGSWARGGYGVAYDISMPKDYDFLQKCGRGWIADDFDGAEDDIRFSFSPSEKDREDEFALYKKEDVGVLHDVNPSTLKIDAKVASNIGKMRFDRTRFTLVDANIRAERVEETAPEGPASGFWLSGEKLSIISDLRDPAREAINERIVASMRRANGYGFTELVFGTIPGLLGC